MKVSVDESQKLRLMLLEVMLKEMQTWVKENKQNKVRVVIS